MITKLTQRKQIAFLKFKNKIRKNEKGDVTLTAQEAEGFLAKRAKRN